MSDLKTFLLNRGYKFFKLKKTKSQHFIIKGKINGIYGNFILDTGASHSCVGLDEIRLFNLKFNKTDKIAAGAGSNNIKTQISKKNILKLKQFSITNLTLVIIDLSHINTALIEHKSFAVNGILGADILKKYKAIIDYQYKAFYLKS